MEKIPYMLVLGEKEQQARLVAVRHRTEGDKGTMALGEMIERLQQELSTKGQAPAVGN